MTKRIRLLRELGMNMNETYTRAEILLACREEIFSRAWDMDTALLLEALRALDDRPREDVCPHMERDEQRLMRAIDERTRGWGFLRANRKLAAAIAAALLLIGLAAGGAAYARFGGGLPAAGEAGPFPGATGKASGEQAGIRPEAPAWGG